MIRLEILIIIFILDNMNNQINVRDENPQLRTEVGEKRISLSTNKGRFVIFPPPRSQVIFFLNTNQTKLKRLEKPRKAQSTHQIHPRPRNWGKKKKKPPRRDAAADGHAGGGRRRRGAAGGRHHHRADPKGSFRFPHPLSLSLSISLGFLEKMAPLAIASAKDQIFFVPGWTSIEPFCSCLAFNQMGGGGINHWGVNKNAFLQRVETLVHGGLEV